MTLTAPIARAERAPTPFTPADLPAHRLLPRALFCHCRAAVRTGENAEDVARQLFPRDPATLALVQRASVPPASLGGWGSQLAGTAVASFIGSLVDSAAAALINAAPRFSLDGRASMTLPRASGTSAPPQWLAENSPIPAIQSVITAATLVPHKLAAIESFTTEMAESSAPDGESIMSTILSDSLRAQLDTSLFGSTAASSTQPGGLLAGLTSLTPTTGGGLGAAIGDLRQLGDAVALAGGGGRPMYFTSSGRAVALRAYAPAEADRIIGSGFINSNTLICVDPNGFASAYDANPTLSATAEALIHFEDVAPQQIGTAGSPPVVAAPTRSAFQSDLVVVRAILRAGWTMRVPAVAFVQAPTW